MVISKIQCPHCQARFTLKTPSLEMLSGKSFKCPKCAFAVPFAKLLPIGNGGKSLHTVIAGGQGVVPGEKTKITQDSSQKVELIVEGIPKTLKLGKGVYTIGRDSVDSNATLRVSPDKYMSRLQAQLEVTYNPSGTRSPQCRICCLNTKNPIYVNNQRLEAGKYMNLKKGDKLLLGMTTVLVNM